MAAGLCKPFFLSRLIPSLPHSLKTFSTASAVATFHAVNVEVTDDRVKEILRQLTGCDLDKVFELKKEYLVVPKYQLMTDEELKEAHSGMLAKAAKVLEMPPVVDQRKRIDTVLSVDKKLKGYDRHHHVFVDISMSATNKSRRVVVRETDGTLREASWDERDRMNQIYYPREGRKLAMPKMLTGEYLPAVLKAQRHSDVLDLCNVQCEPDSPQYSQIHHFVYEDIITKRLFDLLHSTRHFGGLVWYMVRTDNVREFVKDLLAREMKEDLASFVELYDLAYSESQSSSGEIKEAPATDRNVEVFLKRLGLQHLNEIDRTSSV